MYACTKCKRSFRSLRGKSMHNCGRASRNPSRWELSARDVATGRRELVQRDPEAVDLFSGSSHHEAVERLAHDLAFKAARKMGEFARPEGPVTRDGFKTQLEELQDDEEWEEAVDSITSALIKYAYKARSKV